MAREVCDGAVAAWMQRAMACDAMLPAEERWHACRKQICGDWTTEVRAFVGAGPRAALRKPGPGMLLLRAKVCICACADSLPTRAFVCYLSGVSHGAPWWADRHALGLWVHSAQGRSCGSRHLRPDTCRTRFYSINQRMRRQARVYGMFIHTAQYSTVSVIIISMYCNHTDFALYRA